MLSLPSLRRRMLALPLALTAAGSVAVGAWLVLPTSSPTDADATSLSSLSSRTYPDAWSWTGETFQVPPARDQRVTVHARGLTSAGRNAAAVTRYGDNGRTFLRVKVSGTEIALEDAQGVLRSKPRPGPSAATSGTLRVAVVGSRLRATWNGAVALRYQLARAYPGRGCGMQVWQDAPSSVQVAGACRRYRPRPGGAATSPTAAPSPSTAPPSVSPTATPTVSPTATPTSNPRGGMQELQWHHGWAGPKLSDWPSDVRNETDIAVWGIAQSAGAGTGKLTSIPRKGYASDAAVKADVTALTRQGKHVLLGIGGSSDGGITISSQATVAQAFESINNQVSTYGFNGISLDLEPSGSSWSREGIVSLVAQLKKQHGRGFMVDVCVGLYGDHTANWIGLAKGLGSNMDSMSVMLYDFPEAGDARLSSVSVDKLNILAGAGIPASKVLLLYMMRPNAGYTNATPNAQLVVQAIKAARQAHPTLRGFGWWEDQVNAQQGWSGPRAVQSAF